MEISQKLIIVLLLEKEGNVCVRNRSNKKDWLAIVFTRYMYLSVYQRKDQDERTISEIFNVGSL